MGQWLNAARFESDVSSALHIPECFIVVPRRGRAEDDGPLEDGEHRENPEDKKKEKKEKKEKEKEKEKKQPVTDGTDHPDPEIAEANRLRAALGLKPLRP